MDHQPVLIIINLFVLLHMSYGTKLSAHTVASFQNPDSSSPFSHFAIHNYMGNVYIGAKDALYQLEKDFTRKYVVSTEAECEDPNRLCPNYNKILLIDYENERLIECGSENRGICNARNLTDVNSVIQVGSSGVTAPGQFSTEAIVAPGPQNNGTDVMYVAKTVRAGHNDRSYESDFLVSRRYLTKTESLFHFDFKATVQMDNNFDYYNFVINYTSSFVLNTFTYFVTNQNTDDYRNPNSFVSKLCRVCQNSYDFDSFSEVTLSCQGQDGTIYNLIQDAYLGAAGMDLSTSLNISVKEKILYGIFAKGSNVGPTMESGVCLFREKDIKDAFSQVVKNCIVQGDEFGIWYTNDRYRCYGFGTDVRMIF